MRCSMARVNSVIKRVNMNVRNLFANSSINFQTHINENSNKKTKTFAICVDCSTVSRSTFVFIQLNLILLNSTKTRQPRISDVYAHLSCFECTLKKLIIFYSFQ